jgi:radical SAM protein with 4Fe4S-binding SPASM domain
MTLTESCNLKCVYCFEKAKTKQFMDIQVAKNAIEYEFNNSDEFDEIEFDLFGGEPTLCKDTIKELVEWTYNQEFGKPFLFFIETNGTLVHGEFQEWLLKNKEYVYAGLSLDGTPETHNKNRSNSYEKIDIDFFLENYPEQSVRMTINRDTVCNLSKDIIHLHNLGFGEIVATFAHGINWELDGIEDCLVAELDKLSDYYLANPSIKECSIFDINLPNILREGKIEKWCGTGTSMVSYGIDGSKYPCHTFQSNTTVESEAIQLGEIDFEKIEDYSDPECSNCILESICPNCYGMNYVETGNILTRDKQLCEIFKIRAIAATYLKARQIEQNQTHMKPNELFNTIKAIKKIQGEFLSI